MKKLCIVINIFFLGLIICPKNLKLNAADVPDTQVITDPSFFGDGDFKLIREYEYFAYYYYFENPVPSAYISVNNVNLDYLYYVSDGDYYVIRIKNGVQFNLNMSYNFDDCVNGLYWSNLVNDHGYFEIMNLKTKVKSSIIEYDFNPEAIAKMYKLDYIYYETQIKTFYLFVIKDGQLVDISNTLILFNLIGMDYRLFKVIQKSNEKSAKITDSVLSYDLYLNNFNLIEFQVDDYLLYTIEKNIYSKVEKKYVDSLMVDIINNTYDYLLYKPTFADYMQMVTEKFDSKVKSVYGDYKDNSILNGLYVIGYKNELFKLFSYDYEKRLNGDKTDFVKTYQFYPYYSFKANKDINLDYKNKNTDYLIYELGYWNVYGYNPLPADKKELVAFINDIQIDISLLSTKDLVWLFDLINDEFVNNINDYSNLLSNTFINNEIVDINNYSDVPNSKGFVKFVKKDKYYDAYFYINGKYYKYKNMDMIDKLNDDIATYKIRFEKNSESLIIEFTNQNETLYWDLLKKKWIKEHHVFITGEKKFTGDNLTKGLVYSYIHFNINIDVDKITNIVFNYDTRLVKSFVAIKNYSDWQNVTSSINNNNFNENQSFSIFSTAKYFFHASKTKLSESIKESAEPGYQWQVLLNYDYYTNSVLDIVGLTSSALGIAKVKREYKDLALMEMSYWKDGVFYEHVDVDDEHPGNGDSGWSKGLIDDIIAKAKETINKYKWIKYVLYSIGALLALKFVVWLFPKKRYRRR